MKIKGLLAATALTVSGTAQATWFEASSRHFIVYSDDTLDHLKEYTQRLERFDGAVRVLHGDADPDRGNAGRVIVYVVPTVDDVQKLHKNAAGFWNPAALPIAVMPRATGAGGEHGFTPQAIMFHEYTHHWMLTSWSAAGIPAWYAEGAAEFHATAQVRPDGAVLFGAPPAYRMYGVTMLKNQMPVHDLLRAVPGKLEAEQTEALYGRGWLLTSYMTMDAARRKQLAEYIVAINSGKTPSDAAASLGGVTDAKLDSWSRQPKFPSILVPADEIHIGDVRYRQLGPGEAAIMPTLIRSRSGVDEATAPRVVAQARAVAAQFPNDPAVQNELAEAELDNAEAGKLVDAPAGYARVEAACDRALAADPKSMHALLYKGMAKEAAALDAKKTDAATWNEVRRWYIAANRAETENAEPLIRFYNSFRLAKQVPTAGAQRGALYAYALAPHYANARVEAAKVLLTDGKVAEGRAAFAPIAYNGESGASKELSGVLTAIDSGGAQAGLDAIRKLEEKADADREKARAKRG